MKIKMIVDTKGSANISGNVVKTYKKDEIVDCSCDWQKTLGTMFVDEGFAMELKVSEPTETKTKKKAVKKKATKKAK